MNNSKRNNISYITLTLIIKGIADCWAKRLSLSRIIESLLCNKQKLSFGGLFVEIYVLSWVLILYISLLYKTNVFIVSLVIYRSIDMLLYLIHDLGVKPKDFANGLRTLILYIVNYFQIILIFAIIFKLKDNPHPFIESLNTITLKYNLQSPIYICEAFIGIFFISIFIAKAMTILNEAEKE